MLVYDRKRDTLSLSVHPSFAVGMISFLAGAFIGAFLVESIDKILSEGPDESGSMGIWLPSGAMISMACVGGFTGLVIYRLLCLGLSIHLATPRRVLAILFFAAMLVSIGAAVGAFVGDLSMQTTTWAIRAGVIGLAVMEMRKCMAKMFQSLSSH